MSQGRIIKALSGFYYVEDGDKIIQCRARGKFRKDEIKCPLLVIMLNIKITIL